MDVALAVVAVAAGIAVSVGIAAVGATVSVAPVTGMAEVGVAAGAAGAHATTNKAPIIKIEIETQVCFFMIVSSKQLTKLPVKGGLLTEVSIWGTY
jgi:hypothetical protein